MSRKGQLDKSINEFDSAISFDQGQAWAHNRRGHVLRLLGDLDGALRAHETALSIVPEDSFAYCGIGTVKYQRGWLDEAVDYYNRAIRSKPDYVNALSGLGRTFNRKREYAKAEQLLRDALSQSIQTKASIPSLHLYLSISQLNRGPSSFLNAADALTESLKQFDKRVKHINKDHSHWGTHTFYQYSIALLLANSPKFKEILNEAVRFCSARGLRDEIVGDLEGINPEVWSIWTDFSAKRTSKTSLGVRPQDLAATLSDLR